MKQPNVVFILTDQWRAQADIPIPATIEGEDLSAMLAGHAEDPDRAALFMSVSPSGCRVRVRTKERCVVSGEAGAWGRGVELASIKSRSVKCKRVRVSDEV